MCKGYSVHFRENLPVTQKPLIAETFDFRFHVLIVPRKLYLGNLWL